MRIDDRKKYEKALENAIIPAGKNILRRDGVLRNYVILRYEDIQKLSQKYLGGKHIRQVSFHKMKVCGNDHKILDAMKIALNKNHAFIYEKDVVDKIKKGDKDILCVFERDKNGKKDKGQ